mgnify:CR=1 FL=1
MPVLDAQGLSKSFGDRVLLDRVDVTIRRGEKVGVVGDNGAGKSTLGRVLAGLIEPDLGTLHLRKGARVEYLHQEPSLPEGKTAREVALSGLGEWLESKARYDKLCEELATNARPLDIVLEEQAHESELLERLGGFQKASEAERILAVLGIERVEQLVETMSGGEKRRVALARLLIAAPDLAILDEPTNHLDATTIELTYSLG